MEYQREKVSTPPGLSRDRKVDHASTVYREFSLNTKAPAAVAAQVSMSEA